MALKNIQQRLRHEVEVLMTEQKGNNFKYGSVSQHQTAEGDRKHFKRRTYTVIRDVTLPEECHRWS